MFRRSKTPPPAPVGSDDGDARPLPQRLSPRSPSEALKPTAAPPPPEEPKRERGGMLGMISGLFTLSVVLAIGAMIALTMLNREFREPGPLATDKVVVIPSRSGTSEIAEALSREGVIAHTTLFELAARFRGTPPAAVGLASGRTWPDALVGAAAMGGLGGPLLLTDPSGLSPQAASALAALTAPTGSSTSTTAATRTAGVVFGGTSSVSDDARRDLQLRL